MSLYVNAVQAYTKRLSALFGREVEDKEVVKVEFEFVELCEKQSSGLCKKGTGNVLYPAISVPFSWEYEDTHIGQLVHRTISISITECDFVYNGSKQFTYPSTFYRGISMASDSAGISKRKLSERVHGCIMGILGADGAKRGPKGLSAEAKKLKSELDEQIMAMVQMIAKTEGLSFEDAIKVFSREYLNLSVGVEDQLPVEDVVEQIAEQVVEAKPIAINPLERFEYPKFISNTDDLLGDVQSAFK